VCFVLTERYHALRFNSLVRKEVVVVPDTHSNTHSGPGIENKSWYRWLTLFITSSTLLCCALPILLVSLGFGAVVASMNYNIPGLLFVAEHKYWALTLSALMLVFLAWIIWRPNQVCPTDPELASTCQRAKIWNKRVLWFSILIWITGVFFSTLLLPLRNLINS